MWCVDILILPCLYNQKNKKERKKGKKKKKQTNKQRKRLHLMTPTEHCLRRECTPNQTIILILGQQQHSNTLEILLCLSLMFVGKYHLKPKIL